MNLQLTEDQMTTNIRVLCTAVFVQIAAFACASGVQKEANSRADDSADTRDSNHGERALNAPAPAYSQVNAEANSCAERPCFSSSDCCKGYSCGFDPELSHVQRYCLGN